MTFQRVRKLLEAKEGVRVSLETGELQRGYPDRMSTLHFYRAEKGSRLHLLSKDYLFAIATYSPEIDLKYIYTFDYQSEESWTSYNHDLTPESYGQNDIEFQEELYFRVNLKRTDGNEITEAEAGRINSILEYTTLPEVYFEKPYFQDEVRKTADKIKCLRKEGSVAIALLTDTHYVVNGTWEDTIHNLRAVHKEAAFDAVIHLGDFTDGLVSAKVLKDYTELQLKALLDFDIPLFVTLGNHDSNYYRNNPEWLSKAEQQEFYFTRIDKYINRKPEQTYYYSDFEQVKTRGIFLDSYDYKESVRYGFPTEELDWLEQTLQDVPEGYSVILFSHVPPIVRLHYWSKEIRNSDRLMRILEEYDAGEGNRILAYVHGHNHTDQIYTESRFPIIAIGCTKCEYFSDKKPEGAVTSPRELNTLTQELWDTMIINPCEKRIDFVRFGAGEDRTVILGN